MSSAQVPAGHLNHKFLANPEHLIKLGCALIASGEGEKALALVERAQLFAPDDPLLREACSVVLTYQVPDFHAAMLADGGRNNAYAAAIGRGCPGQCVLDVGTGSGVLAMMAARAGAAEVIACEANPMLAATAREIVAKNKIPGICIIDKHSRDIDASELTRPVDVVIHEVFGHDVIGEGVLNTIADAVTRLGKSSVKAIPAQASIRVALVQLDTNAATTESLVVEQQYDVRLFSRHIRSWLRVDVGDARLQLRSDSCDLFNFDFADPGSLIPTLTTVEPVSSGGPVNGVVQWLWLGLDEQVEYENRPAIGAFSHWKAIFHPFRGTATEAGDRFIVNGWHDGTNLRIWGSRR